MTVFIHIIKEGGVDGLGYYIAMIDWLELHIGDTSASSSSVPASALSRSQHKRQASCWSMLHSAITPSLYNLGVARVSLWRRVAVCRFLLIDNTVSPFT